MTLNLKCPPIFPTLSSEEGLCSSVEGYADKNFDGLAKNTWNFNLRFEDSFDYIKEKDEEGNTDDSVPDDILAILPADPFGMDVAATFTAIAGWFEDIENDRGSDSHSFGIDEIETNAGDHQVLGLDLLCDMSQPHGYKKGVLIDKDFDFGSNGGGLISGLNIGACMSFNLEGALAAHDQFKKLQDCDKLYPENDAGYGNPHDALFFTLGYLGLQDLLSVERVCRSLRNAVKNDPILWRNIYINKPFCGRITDDTLLQLIGRAQGTLQSLSLVGCLGITDIGLKQVFESNLGLTKLSVPECVKLSIGGILYNLKALKSKGAPGIQHLRISGIYGVTNTELEELNFLLGANNCTQLKSHKPRLYCPEELDAPFDDDDRAIDIEACPKCQGVRLVYDCPMESCQGKGDPVESCRACTLCVARCARCGRCIDECIYEEMFLTDLCCLDCLDE